jgi:uncharacterized protein YfaT (DUF1175 family)
MVAPHKTWKRRLVPLFMFPLVLLPAVFLLIRYNSRPSTSANTAKPATAELTQPEPGPDADLDHDGIPDNSELRSFNDRENFRRWFTWIAEMQFYKLSDEWNSEQRDCAGLVRFAWRESLRTHDRPWYRRMGENYEAVAADVTVSLTSAPLGEKLFRTAPGTYSSSDVAKGKFSEFADAQTLKMFNATFVGRDREEARPGDLLFFHQPWVQKYPYHVMIFVGESRLANEGARDWVVYHTGASPADAGTVKKVRLAVLDQHPNKRWRPVQSNPNFLGFYRLKILNQQVALEE